jgi:hypothetical protein
MCRYPDSIAARHHNPQPPSTCPMKFSMAEKSLMGQISTLKIVVFPADTCHNIGNDTGNVIGIVTATHSPSE